MNPRFVLRMLVLSAFFSGVVHAAGGPMNEDLSPLAPVAQTALDAAKRGDAEAFVSAAQEALTQAKAKAASASQQRIVGRLKTAVAEGKAGKLVEGAQAVEEAMTDMKKGPPPRFGGGS